MVRTQKQKFYFGVICSFLIHIIKHIKLAVQKNEKFEKSEEKTFTSFIFPFPFCRICCSFYCMEIKKKHFWHVHSYSCFYPLLPADGELVFRFQLWTTADSGVELLGCQLFWRLLPSFLTFTNSSAAWSKDSSASSRKKRAPLWKMRVFIFFLAALGEFSLIIFIKNILLNPHCED